MSYWKSLENVIDISGDTVVWEANGNIYGADVSDLNAIEVFTICDDAVGQYNPVVSGDIVVWTDQRNDGGDIYGASILDMKDVQSFPIVKKIGTQRQPAIDKDTIVYISSWGLSKSAHGEIKLRRLTDFPKSAKINLKKSYFGQRPAINGNLIVWQGGSEKERIAEGISIERSLNGEPANTNECQMED